MLGDCLYETEEAKAKCLFMLSVLHCDSYIIFKAHGIRGDILIKPSSFDSSVVPSKASVRNFKTKLLFKPLKVGYEFKPDRHRRIEKQEALALSYQRERVRVQPLI